MKLGFKLLNLSFTSRDIILYFLFPFIVKLKRLGQNFWATHAFSSILAFYLVTCGRFLTALKTGIWC